MTRLRIRPTKGTPARRRDLRVSPPAELGVGHHRLEAQAGFQGQEVKDLVQQGLGGGLLGVEGSLHAGGGEGLEGQGVRVPVGVDQGEGEEEVAPDGGLAAGVVDPAQALDSRARVGGDHEVHGEVGVSWGLLEPCGEGLFVGVGVLAQEGAGAAWGVGEEAFIPHGVGGLSVAQEQAGDVGLGEVG